MLVVEPHLHPAPLRTCGERPRRVEELLPEVLVAESACRVEHERIHAPRRERIQLVFDVGGRRASRERDEHSDAPLAGHGFRGRKRRGSRRLIQRPSEDLDNLAEGGDARRVGGTIGTPGRTNPATLLEFVPGEREDVPRRTGLSVGLHPVRERCRLLQPLALRGGAHVAVLRVSAPRHGMLQPRSGIPAERERGDDVHARRHALRIAFPPAGRGLSEDVYAVRSVHVGTDCLHALVAVRRELPARQHDRIGVPRADRAAGLSDARQQAFALAAEEIEEWAPLGGLVPRFLHRAGERLDLGVRQGVEGDENRAHLQLVPQFALRVELPGGGEFPDVRVADILASNLDRREVLAVLRLQLPVPAIGEVVDAGVDGVLHLAFVLLDRTPVIVDPVGGLHVRVERRAVPEVRRTQRGRRIVAEPRARRQRAVPVHHAHDRAGTLPPRGGQTRQHGTCECDNFHAGIIAKTTVPPFCILRIIYQPFTQILC